MARTTSLQSDRLAHGASPARRADPGPSGASAHQDPRAAQGAELAHMVSPGVMQLEEGAIGAGVPLDSATRQVMEQRFGRDLSHIRIHNDARAAQACNQAGAYAFTLKNHIVFAQGAYSPTSQLGMALLSHEITHFLQGGGQVGSAAGPVSMSDAGGSHEGEAHQNAMTSMNMGAQGVAQTGHLCQAGCPCLGQTAHLAGLAQVPALASLMQRLPSGTTAQGAARMLGQKSGSTPYTIRHAASGARMHRCARATTEAPAPVVTLPEPTIQQIAANGTVSAQIATAWTNSNPNSQNGATKVEQGFWIIWNKTTGAYTFNHFPPGSRDGSSPTPRPADTAQTKTVAFFHTHPNTSAEGYGQGPSPADTNFSRAQNLPHIIRSHDGTATYTP